MPPVIALFLVASAVGIALVADRRRKPASSAALWIPQLWLLVIASRPLAGWFTPGGVSFDAALADGSALDRNILSLLIAMAGVVLVRRRLAWVEWIKANPWVFLFFLYCGVSVLWSDFPAVALKRWIRAIGSVMMVMVVLSEANPVAATTTLVRRCAYILIPFSILVIRYYRPYGVGYNYWTGEEYLAGVTTDKNALGRLCLVAVLFGVLELINRKIDKETRAKALNWLIGLVILAFSLWLLRASKSATSLATTLLGCGVMLGLGLSPMRKMARHLGLVVVAASLFAALVLSTTNLLEFAVTSLGRDLTFTDRTFVWRDLIAMGTNPLVGVGYDSFWLGSRLQHFMDVHAVNEAHNGYLEVYLELGAIGLLLFLGILFSVFRAAKRSLRDDRVYGRLQMAFLTVFLIYNITEAAYKVTTLMFFMLLLVGMSSPLAASARVKARARAIGTRTRAAAGRVSFRLPRPAVPGPLASQRKGL